MQPIKIDNRQEDIFRERLSNELNQKHEIMILSCLIRFRNRIGANRMERILSLTVSVAVESKAVKVNDLTKVIVDTTVMPKNIGFPTDSKIFGKARERLVKLAAKNGIELRQNYNLHEFVGFTF